MNDGASGFRVELREDRAVIGAAAPRGDRPARRDPRHPRPAGAVGSRRPALPLLPRLRGPRPQARRAGRLARGRPIRPDRPPVVRGPRLHHAGRQPDGSRASPAGRPRRSAIVEGAAQRVIVEGDRLRGVELDGDRSVACDGVVRPAAIRPQQRPARRASAATSTTTDGHHRRPTGGRASPASGWRATSRTHAPRSSPPPAKDPRPPSPSTPTSSTRTCATPSSTSPALTRPQTQQRTHRPTGGTPMTNRTAGPQPASIPPPSKHQLSADDLAQRLPDAHRHQPRPRRLARRRSRRSFARSCSPPSPCRSSSTA